MEKFERAKNLLSDDFFLEVVNTLKATQVDTIINSEYEDIDKRERAYQYIQMLDSFVSHITSISDDQKIKRMKWKIL